MSKKIDVYRLVMGLLIAGFAITKFQESEFFMILTISLSFILSSTKKAFARPKVFKGMFGVTILMFFISIYFLIKG